MTTNTYPYLQITLRSNPAVAAAHNYWQDDSFGNLIDTFGMCIDDGNKTCYMYAFIEREHRMTYNPIFYGSH